MKVCASKWYRGYINSFLSVHHPIFHTHFLPASILVKFISKTLHLQRNFQAEIEGTEHTSVWPDVATQYTRN